MPSQTIQWFPGHMAKTRRLITENLGSVDIVIELLDARIPASSKNPEIDRLTEHKPRLTVLTKASLADPQETEKWIASDGRMLAVDTVTGEGVKAIAPTVKKILADKLKKYEEKGMKGRAVRAMIVGIPNVGKSSLVNRLGGGKKAKVENRPGVTLTKQWVTTSVGIELLDMPGVLWPRFDDRTTGERLAFTGAIRDAILDTEALGCALCRDLYREYRTLFCTRYKLDADALEGATPYELLSAVARKRGFLLSGGELNTERAAEMVLDEFREAKIGRITLDPAPEVRREERAERAPDPAEAEKDGGAPDAGSDV